jgi:RNA polymerase sigma-70 factor, ECF subfamily
MAEADERRLIEAAQRDPGRFADLYEQNFERVYAYIVMRVRDRAEAQDLTARVFEQALENLAKFEWRGVAFAAWLYRMAANAIADRARQVQREQTVDPPELACDGQFEEIERRAEIFRLVKDLPEEQRKVVEMRFVEERSIRDVAREIGRSEGAVKQLQFRGLQNLRDRMGGGRHG